MIKNVLWIVGATILMLWVLGSFIPDAHSKEDCEYVKIIQYKDGDIINSKTEYACDSKPEILIQYVEKKSKAEKMAELFKPIKPSSSPDPTHYYGNYADDKPKLLDALLFGIFN